MQSKPAPVFDGGLYHLCGTCKHCKGPVDVVVKPDAYTKLLLCVKHSACARCVDSFFDISNETRSKREFCVRRMCRLCTQFFRCSFPVTADPGKWGRLGHGCQPFECPTCRLRQSLDNGLVPPPVTPAKSNAPVPSAAVAAAAAAGVHIKIEPGSEVCSAEGVKYVRTPTSVLQSAVECKERLRQQCAVRQYQDVLPFVNPTPPQGSGHDLIDLTSDSTGETDIVLTPRLAAVICDLEAAHAVREAANAARKAAKLSEDSSPASVLPAATAAAAAVPESQTSDAAVVQVPDDVPALPADPAAGGSPAIADDGVAGEASGGDGA